MADPARRSVLAEAARSSCRDVSAKTVTANSRRPGPRCLARIAQLDEQAVRLCALGAHERAEQLLEQALALVTSALGYGDVGIAGQAWALHGSFGSEQTALMSAERIAANCLMVQGAQPQGQRHLVRVTDVDVRLTGPQFRTADAWLDLHVLGLHVLGLRCNKGCLLLKFAERQTMHRVDATGASPDLALGRTHHAWPVRPQSSSLEDPCS